MTAIRTRGLTKRYGAGDEAVVALEDLDLEIADGEEFGFLGPNGAGKTTTIDLLLDLVRPTEGTATVLGHDTRAETDAVRDRVGVLPEGFDLWDRSSGYRHLEFAIESRGGDADPDALLERAFGRRLEPQTERVISADPRARSWSLPDRRRPNGPIRCGAVATVSPSTTVATRFSRSASRTSRATMRG